MNIWEIFGISPPSGLYNAWDRESDNVEDRRDWRGVGSFAQPQLIAPPAGEWKNPWDTNVEFAKENPNIEVGPSSPDMTKGLLPPLGDFLSGKEGPTGQPSGEMQNLTSEYVGQVKKLEGWNPRAYPDYKQHSIGYGTRAKSPGEVIDKAEGERRLIEELQKAENSVRAMGIPMSPSQLSSLTDLTYNAGSGWQNWELGRAVKAGDWKRAAELYRQTAITVNNGAQTLPGLINRRAQFAPGLLNTDGGTSVAQAPITPAQPFFLEDPANAPQGVVTSRNPQAQAQAPAMGSGMGGMPQPAPPGTPPEAIRGAWHNYFSSPEIQGALLNMMIEATRPRWNQGSLFGDVMNAGLRTIGAADTEEHKRLLEQAGIDQKEEDRLSRERVAQLNADSRYDVAEARNYARMSEIELRNRLKSENLSASEDLKRRNLIRQWEKDLREANFFSKNPISEQEIQAEARKRAMNEIIADRVRGGGQDVNSADGSGQGRPNAGGTGGRQGPVNGVSGAPGGAGKTTPQAPTRGTMTLEQLKADTEARVGVGSFDRALRNPQYRQMLGNRLAPGELGKMEQYIRSLGITQ